MIKLCGIMNKISIGLKLMNHLYKYKKAIDQNVLADIIMNQSYYYLRSKLEDQSTENCFVRFFLNTLHLITKLFLN